MIKTPLEKQSLSNNKLQVFKPNLFNKIFTFDNKPILVLGTPENPLFIGKQICDILGFSKTSKPLNKHVKDKWKIKYKTLTYQHPDISNCANLAQFDIRSDTDLIKESGVYALIFSSKLPNAELFRDKVFEEVLPSIRKHGQYILTQENKQLQLQLAKANEEKLKLQQKHNALSNKHFYYKFKKKGPAFYIIISGLEYKDNLHRVKIGICGCPKRNIQNCPHCEKELEKNNDNDSLDKRLSNHRTLWPHLEVKFVVYTQDARLLEKCLKRVYRKRINPNGHEIIEGIPVSDIIDKTYEYLDMFNVFSQNNEYLIEENIEDYNNKTKTIMKNAVEYTNEYNRFIIESDDEANVGEVDEANVDEDVEDNVEDNVEDADNETNIEDEAKANTNTNTSYLSSEMYEKYSKLLLDIEKFTDRKLKATLREYNLRQYGLKAEKLLRMKNHILKLLEQPTEKMTKTRTCKECGINKVVNCVNFRKLGGDQISWYNKVCIECELKKCKSEILYRVPVCTEIKPNSLTKKCTGCKIVKSYDDFHKNKANRDGLVSRCKNCESYRKSGTINVRLEKKRPENVKKGCKWCPKCEITKSRDDFRKATKRKDGLQSMCKVCDNAAKRMNRLKNKIRKNGMMD